MTLLAADTFAIRRFDAPLGAEVLDLDLSQPLATEDFARLHRAHLQHHVLVFRDQRIAPAQQIAFSRRFGPLQIHVLKDFQLAGHPEVLVVSNVKENGKPIGLGDAGHFWHSDLSYKDKPSLGSLLHAQELPAEGGDTLFASILGLPDDESRDLLAQLFAAAVRPEHVYRHAWQPHDMVFWDNRSVLHLAAGTPDHLRRTLYRTTIEGDVPA